MGCAGSKTDKNTANIDKYLKDEKKKMDTEVKLLLLGAGESGKSTIAKQMKIIHLEGFKDEERLSYKSIIYNNVLASMKALVNACRDLNISVSDEHSAAANRLAEADINYFSGNITDEMRNDIKALWNDHGIKEAYEKQNQFQLNDSAAYYFQNIDRISQANYVPTEQDVLRSRAKTTGIIETEFVIQKN